MYTPDLFLYAPDPFRAKADLKCLRGEPLIIRHRSTESSVVLTSTLTFTKWENRQYFETCSILQLVMNGINVPYSDLHYNLMKNIQCILLHLVKMVHQLTCFLHGGLVAQYHLEYTSLWCLLSCKQHGAQLGQLFVSL